MTIFQPLIRNDDVIYGRTQRKDIYNMQLQILTKSFEFNKKNIMESGMYSSSLLLFDIPENIPDCMEFEILNFVCLYQSTEEFVEHGMLHGYPFVRG